VRTLAPLQLGFATRPRISRAAWALLAVGIVGASVVIGEYQVTLGRLERAEAEAVAAGTRTRASMDPRRLGEALARANTVALELARPWDKAFAALEAAEHPGVSVLSVEPDSKRAEVRIVAEAPDAISLLAYVEMLRSAPPFARVTLQQHEVRAEEPGRPLRFMLVGHWRTER
jgi:hypothetical protein